MIGMGLDEAAGSLLESYTHIQRERERERERETNGNLFLPTLNMGIPKIFPFSWEMAPDETTAEEI
jgi:hypothetical protein